MSEMVQKILTKISKSKRGYRKRLPYYNSISHTSNCASHVREIRESPRSYHS